MQYLFLGVQAGIGRNLGQYIDAGKKEPPQTPRLHQHCPAVPEDLPQLLGSSVLCHCPQLSPNTLCSPVLKQKVSAEAPRGDGQRVLVLAVFAGRVGQQKGDSDVQKEQ